MRQDYCFTNSVPRINAKKISRRRAKKSFLTGSILISILAGIWQLSIFLIGILTVTNFIQCKKRHDRRQANRVQV
ncbi:hypothetical protein [Enterococcus sp. AZ103]|uniref:hypothetical protein n=1 Tax=Enterococcus sp. AZ103 TaxID=2774628 RepID=UPI003F1E5EED